MHSFETALPERFWCRAFVRGLFAESAFNGKRAAARILRSVSDNVLTAFFRLEVVEAPQGAIRRRGLRRSY